MDFVLKNDNKTIRLTQEEKSITLTQRNSTVVLKQVGQRGLKGDKGDAGPQGIQGVKGDTGNTGSTGPKGDKGDTGERGLQGLQGIPGEKGEQGPQGLRGLPGERGEQGERGERGLQGIQGIQGLPGLKGDKGDQGAKGVQGIQGIEGPKGDTGEQGIQGETGEKGDIGPQGLQGVKGDKGDKGEPGDPATNLVTSVSGKQGVVTLNKTDVGLANVDNTSDMNKPVSTATQTALDAKASNESLISTTSQVVTSQARLNAWYTALKNSSTETAQAIVIGDSISEGFLLPSIYQRWINVLQRMLRNGNGFKNGSEMPYVPGYPATASAPTDWPVTRQGNVTASNFGMGSRTASINDGTSSVTFTFTGTRAKVFFTKGNGAGIARVVLDGGTPSTLDTYSAAIVAAGSVYDTGNITYGTHTIVISRDATSATNRLIFVEGMQSYNDNLTSGINIIDASHSGWNTLNFYNNRGTTAVSAAALGKAQLLVFTLGANDYASSISATVFKGNLQAIVASFRAAGFTGSVLYLAVHKGAGRSDSSWDVYVNALQELANADANSAFYDIGRAMPEPESNTPAGESLYFYTDGLHPNERGNLAIAKILAPIFDPRWGNRNYDDRYYTRSEVDTTILGFQNGMTLKSPNGTLWRLTVNDSGNIITTSL